jgi:hypothetical protein
MAFNNVTVNFGAANTLTLTDTLDIDGNLTLTDAGDGFSGAGGIEVAGNLTSTDVACCHSSNAITLDGANAQTVDIATGNLPRGLFTINKTNPTDTVTLISAMSLSASGQDLTITQGILDIGAYDLTVNDVLTVDTNGDITCTSGTITANSETGAGLPYSCGGAPPDLQQIHYRWRNDDGGEVGATWAANQDTVLTDLQKSTTKRLRIEISNEGTATAVGTTYRLEVSEANPSTCAAGTYTRVDSTSDHWDIVTSTGFDDADATSNINPGLSDENTTFMSGQLKESNDQTTGIVLTSTHFTEIEYALQATASATASATYCFRVSNAGSTTDFTYTEGTYGKVTLAGPDLQQLHYRWRNDNGGETGSGWYNSGWAYRKKITVLATEVDADLTNFPVYVDLADLGSDFFANVESSGGNDGGDIRVTNATGTEELPREVVDIDVGAETGELHFKADALSSSENTVFYIYYNNTSASEPAASATYGSQKVWTNNYQAVWHLNEDPGPGGAGDIKDSTSNGNNGTADTSMTSDDLVDTDVKMGQAIEFDGTDDKITFGSAGATDQTISAWVKPRNFAAGTDPDWADIIMSTDDSSSGSNKIGFAVHGNQTVEFSVRNSSSTKLLLNSNATLNANTWYHVVGMQDATAGKSRIYIDGGFDKDRDISSIGASSVNWWMAHNNNGTYPYRFDGFLDEIRISNTVRTAGWISTEHSNQDDTTTFYNVGSEEGNSGGGATWAVAEDTKLTNLAKGTTKRLRFEISNEGDATATGTTYRLEVSEANPASCAAGTYTRIDNNTHWDMVGSVHFTDGAATSNIDPGLSDENTTFVAGELKDADDETTGINLTNTQFTEIEYAVRATVDATDGADYCFRLSDAGSVSDFSNTIYAEVSLKTPTGTTVSSRGSQVSGLNIPSSNKHVGGAFVIREYTGTRPLMLRAISTTSSCSMTWTQPVPMTVLTRPITGMRPSSAARTRTDSAQRTVPPHLPTLWPSAPPLPCASM